MQIQACGPEFRTVQSMQINAQQAWQPACNSITRQRQTWSPNKLASQTLLTGELWAQMRDSTSVYKVERNRGRHPLPLAPTHMHTYIPACTHVCALKHRNKNLLSIYSWLPHSSDRETKDREFMKRCPHGKEVETFLGCTGNTLQGL